MNAPLDAISEVLENAKDQCVALGGAPATSAEVLARTEESAQGRFVALVTLQDGQQMVYKRMLHPNPTPAFADAVSAYKAVEARLADGPFASPALLWSDDANQALVFECHPGLSLDSHLTLAGGDEQQMAPFLTQAGQWMAAYHDIKSAPHVTYQPRFMIDHLTRQMAQIRSGKRSVSDVATFQSAAGQLAELVPPPGSKTWRAPAHGDMHARNILIDAKTGQVCGLDFVAPRQAPIGHDIARLLVDVAVRFGAPAKVKDGAVLPPKLLDAFFRGYGPEYQDDPSVVFLLRYALLAEWLTLPAKSKDRSWRQEHRMDQLRKLVRKAFPR